MLKANSGELISGFVSILQDGSLDKQHGLQAYSGG
jgi:hypothetical protein